MNINTVNRKEIGEIYCRDEFGSGNSATLILGSFWSKLATNSQIDPLYYRVEQGYGSI